VWATTTCRSTSSSLTYLKVDFERHDRRASYLPALAQTITFLADDAGEPILGARDGAPGMPGE